MAAEAERIVNGAGRVALDLAKGNVDRANGRISIDRHLRSASNPQVYVCGNAVPISPQLSPITYEGDIVGRNLEEGPTTLVAGKSRNGRQVRGTDAGLTDS